MSVSSQLESRISSMEASGYRVVEQTPNQVTLQNRDGIILILTQGDDGKISTRTGGKADIITPSGIASRRSSAVLNVWGSAIQCPYCNSLMLISVLYCPKCGEPRSDTRDRLHQLALDRGISYDDALLQERGPYSAELNGDRRNAILQAHIAFYVARGYRVTNQTQTNAQMVKPKEFNFLIAALGLLLLFVGLLLYLIVYASQKEPTVYINVDERGNVQVNEG